MSETGPCKPRGAVTGGSFCRLAEHVLDDGQFGGAVRLLEPSQLRSSHLQTTSQPTRLVSTLSGEAQLKGPIAEFKSLVMNTDPWSDPGRADIFFG